MAARRVQPCAGEREPESASPAAPAPGSVDRSPRPRPEARTAKCASARSRRATSQAARALLGREHLGRALGPEQRAADVARDLDRAVARHWSTVGQVDSGGLFETRTAGTDLLATRVEHAAAERLEQPGAAVGAGAAADADDDPSSASLDRDADELSGAARRRVDAPGVGSSHAPQSRRLRQLDDQLAWRPIQPSLGVIRRACRTGHPMPRDPGIRRRCREEHIERAVAAIGDRYLDEQFRLHRGRPAPSRQPPPARSACP